MRNTFPQSANTVDADLVTQMLVEGTTTVLQHRLAPLRAFSKEVAIDRLKPLAVLQHRKVTAGGTAADNCTNYEDIDKFIGTSVNVPITMTQITVGANSLNSEIQSGHGIKEWAGKKVAEMADAIQAKINGLLTTANYPLSAQFPPCAPQLFGTSELTSLWNLISKSPIKNIILDGAFYSQFLPTTVKSLDPTSKAGMPGWDGFHLNTNWSGAEGGVSGFACNPQALVCGVGLPIRPAVMNTINRETLIKLPELGLTVALTNWASNITRAEWFTWDVMFGVAVNDATAGVVIKVA